DLAWRGRQRSPSPGYGEGWSTRAHAEDAPAARPVLHRDTLTNGLPGGVPTCLRDTRPDEWLQSRGLISMSRRRSTGTAPSPTHPLPTPVAGSWYAGPSSNGGATLGLLWRGRCSRISMS